MKAHNSTFPGWFERSDESSSLKRLNCWIVITMQFLCKHEERNVMIRRCALAGRQL
jgi:hypothetical protein